MKDKYKVAVIKCPVEFSKETYNNAYNKFSQFVAQNTTIEISKRMQKKLVTALLHVLTSAAMNTM